MHSKNDSMDIPQYSLGKILLVWAAAAIPMGILGWVVAPALAADPAKPGFERLAVLTIGLIWESILVLWLIKKEGGSLRWTDLKERLWLGAPRSPKTGAVSRRLWWWIIPLVLLTAVYELALDGYVVQALSKIFPLLAEPPGWKLGSLLDSPEGRAQMVGAWNILLPRMNKVFGKWDWVANGVLFGLYHIHQPWSMVTVTGIFFFAYPTKRFRCAWFGIIAHSGQSIFISFLILGLVLGLA